MAEGLFRSMTANEDGNWEIRSAGIATVGGQPPSAHTLTLLKDKNIDLSGNSSQQITAELINSSSHILAMSASHLYTIESVFPKAADKTFLVTETNMSTCLHFHSPYLTIPCILHAQI